MFFIFLYVSGMLTELDTVMGPLSLTSSMSFLVRYTRQGVHWMRLDSQKVKWPNNPASVTEHLWASSPFTSVCWTLTPTRTVPQALLHTDISWTRCHLMCVLKDRCTCYLLFCLISTFSLSYSLALLWTCVASSVTHISSLPSCSSISWCRVIIGETGLFIQDSWTWMEADQI